MAVGQARAITSRPPHTKAKRRPALFPFAALAILLLSACGGSDPRAPFTDSRIPPGLQHRFYPPDGWAWGLVQPDGVPAARYGVAAPPRRPRADILILASYGEPAEVWFETAGDLNARGYVVWILEPIGQGGSGRYLPLRDLGHAPSLQPDVQATAALAARFIRRRPLILLASRTSAPTALAAVEAGLPVDGVVLSSPSLEPDPPVVRQEAAGRRSVWLGALRAKGGAGWRRDGPDDLALGLTHDVRRARLRLAWQAANPDLRMGDPSWSWRAAFSDATASASPGPLQRVAAPVLVLQPDSGSAPARALCAHLKRCTLQPFGPAGQALPLEVDEVRRAWLAAVDAFIEADIARFSPPPAQARLAPEG